MGSKQEEVEPILVATEATPLDGNTSTSSKGGWKSGLCSCCKYGCCHPALWIGCCCTPILMGHILTRMKMTWTGEPSSTTTTTTTISNDDEYKKTFWTVL